ncbi:very short patch repair endonuclease [Brevundimonas vancanneytii]|uniref:very short patch repair endonuclease n=1 Tax=Brevundimonas vancanneytii TaxID=1325724 RepID=UPI0034D6B8D2
MVDRLSQAKRSWLMTQVRPKDTKPELIVRRVAHSLGYRFRLHRRDLPGTPDIVFPRLRAIIFVHGCFWHRHPGCKKATTPKTSVEFWTKKFQRNVERDAAVTDRLSQLGWRSLVVWECETARPEQLGARLLAFLKNHEPPHSKTG